MVRESLISAYEKNIAPRLKAEVCSLEVNNYNNNTTKDACTSRSSILSLRGKTKFKGKSLLFLVITY